MSKCMGASNHMGDVQMHLWGVNSMPPSVKVTWHFRKLGMPKHMGVLGASGGHPNAWGNPNISYHISYHFMSLWVWWS